MGVNFKRNVKICLLQKVRKGQNKVVVPKEIACGKFKVLSKIGRGNELRKKLTER